MITSTKKRLALGLVVTAAVAAASIGGPAKADPKQFTAVVGVGSDTTQDVTDAFAGISNNINYTPLQSSAATGLRQLISWDAVKPGTNPVVAHDCITPKLGFGAISRPNGSTEGRRALSRAIDGTKYGLAACAGNPIDVSGEIDFARSSAGPAAGDLGTDLTYIPFGRDAMTFGYVHLNPTAANPTVTSLTRAQLTSLFTTGPQVIGGTRLVPCGIQLGSGTYNFWQTVTTATAAQEAAAVATCLPFGNTGLGGRVEENDGNALLTDATSLVASSATELNTEVVIGFSAGVFTAKSNLVAGGGMPTAVKLGSITDNGAGVNIGNPVTGTAPNVVPASSFYSDATFGRNIYTVWPTTTITGLGNNDIKSMVVGSTSSLCSAAATATATAFGFLSLGANCGTTTTKGSLIVGQS